MPIISILTGADHPILRRKAEPVSSFDKKLKKLIGDLLDTVAKAEGAGLAAPQIGVSQRVFVAKVGGRFLPFVNPDIVWCSPDSVQGEEGCLSLPNVWLFVPRSREVVIRFQDEKGELQERKFSDFEAREMQHELDHLNGILLVDYGKENISAKTSPHQAAL